MMQPAERGTARTFRCILVGLDAVETYKCTPALERAVHLAAAYGALLSIHVVSPAIEGPSGIGSGSATGLAQAARRRCLMLGQETASEAARYAVAAGLEPMVSHCQDPFDERALRLVQLARVNDVTILDAAPDDLRDRRIIEDVLFDGGTPVIVAVPAKSAPKSSRIMIAWDGSARAGRAVRDALPLICRADRVDVTTIVGEKDLTRMAPGADLACYLDAHGARNCVLDTLVATNGNAADRLIEKVADTQPDLVVMGAYVHSRFREAILGGVTRTFLERVPAPLLLAH